MIQTNTWIKTENGWRFNTNIDFQALCRSVEYKSALIIYEKYKRKFNLQYNDLLDIRDYAIEFSTERKNAGKSINKDFLIQKLSEYLKSKFA